MRILILILICTKLLRNKKTPMFPNKKGAKISKCRIREIIRQTINKMDINERITPHVLRHTFATEMYLQNVPIEAIMDMMGHSSIEETSLYIHIYPKDFVVSLFC